MAGYDMLRRLTIERNGYGTYKFQISLLFNRETSLKLATFFEFPPADYDAIKRSETPELDFVEMIDAKDIITKQDDYIITDALYRIDMNGIARRVRNLFAQNVNKIRTSCGDIGKLQDIEFDRSEYTFLEDDQFYNEDNTKEFLDILNQRAKQVLNKRLRRYELRCNHDMSSVLARDGDGELRIAVIGKTGQGKSATANSILGIGAFNVDDTATSVTTDPSRRSSLFDGRKVFVVDTPGLQDTDKGEERILREICRIPMLLEKGVHVFIYVFNGADPRFGQADLEVLLGIQEAFGKDFTKYCLVLFTRAESTLKTKSLAAFVEKQKESSEFGYFLDQVDWRISALENSATSLAEKHRNQSSIIALIDKIVSQNVADGQSQVYTTEMFDIAQEEKQRAKTRSQLRGWGEEVYEATEGARAALGEAPQSGEEYFQQMCVRLPLVYNDALQAEKGEKSGFPGDRHPANKNEKLEKKLQAIGNSKSLREELATEMKQQQDDFDSLWTRLWRWLGNVADKIKKACVIS